MKKEEIDEWFGNNFGGAMWETEYYKEYKYETDYYNMTYDEVTVWSDGKIDFRWEELYWGGSNYNSESFENFEDFKVFYENYKGY